MECYFHILEFLYGYVMKNITNFVVTEVNQNIHIMNVVFRVFF